MPLSLSILRLVYIFLKFFLLSGYEKVKEQTSYSWLLFINHFWLKTFVDIKIINEQKKTNQKWDKRIWKSSTTTETVEQQQQYIQEQQ